MSVDDLERRWREARQRRLELEHAKRASDGILRVIGMNLNNSEMAAVQFPGLEEARRLEDEALRAWRKETRNEVSDEA